MIVLWTILKIILWVLLIIFLACVSIISVLVFMPIAYQADIKKEESLYVQATVNILYFFKIEYVLQDETDQTKVFIFGRRVSSKNTKKTKNKVNKQKEYPLSEEHSVSKEDKMAKKAPMEEDKKGEKEQNKQRSKESQEVEQGQSSLQKIKILWGLPNRKRFLKEMRALLKQWIKVILPIIKSFKIKIGLEEPDQTGKLLAALAFLYPWYYQYGDIEGVFDKKGIWGEVELEGKLSLFLFLKPLALFLVKRPVRKYIVKMIKVWREDEEYGI